MVLRANRYARLGWLLILPAILLTAACGGGDGGDDGGGGLPEGTLVPAAQTFLASRMTATPEPPEGTPDRGRLTATPRNPDDDFTTGPIDIIPVEVPPEAQAAVDAVIAEVLLRLIEVNEEDITVIGVTAQQWADSCLEVVYAGQEEVCSQVITPGYEVVVHFADTIITWHTDEDGSTVRFADQQIITG